MGYQPFLIAPFQTGLDTDQEPWLLPQDAFTNIENGHIHHGYIEKRQGYRYLGDMVHGRAISAITNANPAVFTVASTADLTTGDTVSLHYLAGGTWSNLNAIKYTLTVASGTTFTLTDSSGTDVDGTTLGAYTANTGRLGTFPGNRIMGIVRYITSGNTRTLLISDTERVAIYNSGSNIFEPLDLYDIGGTLRTNNDVWASTVYNYIWAGNWQSAGLVNRVYLTNGKAYVTGAPGTDGIVYYDATNRGAPASPNVAQFQPALNSTDTLYGSKLIFSIRQRLVVLYTYEYNGATTNTFPQRARWCAAQNPSNWDDSVAGGGGFVDAPTGDQIISARNLQDILIVAFTDSVWTLRPVPDPALPFRWDKVNDFRSCDGKMASVAYDRYVASLGIRGIVATDAVETRRIDERIDSFTSDEVNSDEFEKVFASRSFSNRRTWVLYPTNDDYSNNSTNDANAALIYDDDSGAWSKYLFTNVNGDGDVEDLNALGYGVANIDYAAQDFIEANGLDKAAKDFADETALSFFWSKNAEIFLGGNRSGTIYVLETTGSDNGSEIKFQLDSAGWNPYKDQGIECQLGYVDFYLDADQRTTLSVEFFKNDDENSYAIQGLDLLPNLYYLASVSDIQLTDAGDPTQGLTITSGNHGLSTGDQIYLYLVEGMEEANNIQFEVTVVDANTFTVDIDATNFSSYTGGGRIFRNRYYRTKVWKRAYAGGIGYLHNLRVQSQGAERPLKIHAMKVWFKPRGRRTLG